MIGIPTFLQLGTLRLSLMKARAHAPKWKFLSREECAALLNVEKSAPIWMLTVTGQPIVHI